MKAVDELPPERVRRVIHNAERSCDCADGPLLINDIARAARISPKDARRAVKAYCAAMSNDSRPTSFGAVLNVTDLVPDPSKMTRAAMASIVAERIGAGVYGIKQRAAARPPQPRKERKQVTTHTHPWRVGDKGRSIRTIDGGNQIATLTCRCGNAHDIRFRELAGSDAIDNKFRQAGWRLNPGKCPACIHPPKEKTVSSATPSPGAIRAQAAMFRLLGQHFDIEAGRYAEGWSDDRIATETKLSPAMVAGVREEAFGPLKEPEEVAALARDIEAFDSMLLEAAASVETLKGEQAAMKERLAALRKKFAA